MSQIETMLLLQQELNDTTNGKNWEEGITKNGKPIDWRRCIYLELAELIDSYPWKHWKNIDAKPDYDNIKIETVDIWHFIMSEALRIYKTEKLGEIKTLANLIEQMPSYQQFKSTNSSEYGNVYSEITIHEQMLKTLFCDGHIDSIMEHFFHIAKVANLNLNQLYALYIGKNILNKFRQDNGYKDGTYKKIWQDREDNVIMQEILQGNPSITPKELYIKLQDCYLS